MEDLQPLQISLPAHLKYSALIRNMAKEIFGYVQFDQTWCNRLKLVVDELFMNAVRYGSTENGSTIHILFEHSHNTFRFTIEDDGTGPKAISAEELKQKVQNNQADTDPSKTSGRGLSMITSQWTDEMIIEPSSFGGIKIQFSKHLQNAQSQPVTRTPVQPVNIAAIGPAANPAPPVAAANGPSETIQLSGEIDPSNVRNLIEPVTQKVHQMPASSALILDFSNMNYINSLFIGQLAGWYTSMKSKGGEIILQNLHDEVKEVLEMVGLLKLIKNQ